MMKSLDLLSQLEAVPLDRPSQQWAFRDQIVALLGTNRMMYAAECSAAASIGIWAIFDEVNVDDALRERLLEAYELQYPGEAASESLHDKCRDLMGEVPDAQEGFINGIKGKIAELEVRDQLTEVGCTVEFPESATHPGIDLIATSPEGLQVPIQVKHGGEGYAGEVTNRMMENPDVYFMVNPEI